VIFTLLNFYETSIKPANKTNTFVVERATKTN